MLFIIVQDIWTIFGGSDTHSITTQAYRKLLKIVLSNEAYCDFDIFSYLLLYPLVFIQMKHIVVVSHEKILHEKVLFVIQSRSHKKWMTDMMYNEG